ncbi:ECF-type sigma factor [Luteolibacter luteus]|uniref:Sigma-70 family RNA polymerase sigma factor n=1 Tax=Luteolibacter luteus TaxID=2728835 RepID=A0A858RF91_9BACT|nr:ECF-type sigma factor [Luteolibacter luteus]QJE95099.1 sigma-70 family RNA polymerase sigma factor [Luteolibacter luteus]
MSSFEVSGLPEDILPMIYSQLRRMAAARMGAAGAGQTLQPTALVHEAWLRLSANRGERAWNDPSHFCAAAAEAMRHILIDRARQRSRIKRWGDQERVPMAEAEQEATGDDEKTLLIDEALERLKTIDPVRAKIVLLRFFGGLSNQEIAQEMSLSERSVERQWSYARAWLYREIRPRL